MQNGKRRIALCALFLTTTLILPAAPALAAPPTAHPLPAASTASVSTARAVHLIDAATGDIHMTENAAVRMPIASLTKVMTAYVILGEAKPTDTVTIAKQDVRYAQRGGGTRAHLRPGDRLTVRDLLYALMLPSGADAAHALARAYGPGVPAFVAKMNATARSLGLRDTHYVNADGLPAPGGDGHSTAHDQALLTATALKNPLFAEIAATRTHSVPATATHRSYHWATTNRLLGTPGVIGVKTGFTRAAGYCLAFAADRNGTRLIGVILGAPSSTTRYQTATSLLAVPQT